MYITKDDYFNARGIDLTIELNDQAQSSDNPSNFVNIKLQQMEDITLDFINHYFETPENGEFEPEIMKKVMVYQVDYFLLKGLFVEPPLSKQAYYVLKQNGYANPLTQGYAKRYIL